MIKNEQDRQRIGQRIVMRNEGYSLEQINAYFDDAKSSDYNHLVSVSGEKIREINRKLREN